MVIIILFFTLASRTLLSNLVSSIHILVYVLLHMIYERVLLNKKITKNNFKKLRRQNVGDV